MYGSVTVVQSHCGVMGIQGHGIALKKITMRKESEKMEQELDGARKEFASTFKELQEKHGKKYDTP